MSHMLRPEAVLPVVVADLHYIRDEWRDDISDDALRRGSSVLRRLLVQGELQRAWKAANFQREPVIRCASLRGLQPEHLSFAAAGGAKCNGVVLTAPVIPRSRESAKEFAAQQLERLRSGEITEPMKLSQFTGAPCVVIKSVPIARRVVVNYVANKLGGAHFDHKRSDAEPLFRLLDGIHTEMMLAGKPVVFFELLAMGQALADSEDMKNLMNAPP